MKFRFSSPKIKPPKFRVRYNWKSNLNAVRDYYHAANLKFLNIVGGLLRKWVIKATRRVKDKGKHSAPGVAPHAHLLKSKFLKPAVWYVVQNSRMSVIVGIRKDVAGFWGKKHEHGGVYPVGRGKAGMATFHKRPMIAPQAKRIEKIRGVLYKRALGLVTMKMNVLSDKQMSEVKLSAKQLRQPI